MRRWRPPEGGLTFSQRARIEAADPHRLPRGGAKAKVRGDGVSCRLRGAMPAGDLLARGSSLPVTPVGVLAVDAVLAPPTAAPAPAVRQMQHLDDGGGGSTGGRRQLRRPAA
jgi:hypothetical protein